MKITADDCVRVLKEVGLSWPAACIAAQLGSTSRAVATALRGPTSDGRIGVAFHRGVAHYTYLRAAPKDYTPMLPKLAAMKDKAVGSWIWRNGYFGDHHRVLKAVRAYRVAPSDSVEEGKHG